MENEQATKQLFKGALLLTLAGIVSKILSAGYRIPLQNITGDLGFYIYQQIYPFLGIALILSLYGFPTAISKLVSEQRESGYSPSLTSFYFPVFGLLFCLNAILFLGLLINADKIAIGMGDEKLSNPIQVAAFIFLIIPFTSIIRGVFQGHNNMAPTATSQVTEQFVRVSYILITAIVLVKEGKDLYTIGSGAAVGSIIGAIAAFAVLITIWLRRKPVSSQLTAFSWFNYLKVIVIYGVFISVNHMLLLLLQFSDAFTLVPNLVAYGFSLDEAKQWKGVFDRGQPLVQLGTVLGSSLALALIPSITKKRLAKHPDQFHSHIQSALKFSFYLSIGATVGLIAIFPHVNILFFENDLGTTSLQTLSCAVVFTSLGITTATILQGLGYVYSTATFVMVGLGVKWLLNSSLIPLYGIIGSALATVISVFIVLLFNVYRLKRVLPNSKLFAIPWTAFSISLSGLILFIYIMNAYGFEFLQITSRFDYLGYVLFVSIVGAAIYLFLLIRLKAFTTSELQALPFGELLVEFMQGRN